MKVAWGGMGKWPCISGGLLCAQPQHPAKGKFTLERLRIRLCYQKLPSLKHVDNVSNKIDGKHQIKVLFILYNNNNNLLI